MIVRNTFVFALAALCVFGSSRAHFPEYCAECEQEIWEQVPCSEVSSTTITPPTTTASSTIPPDSSTEDPDTTTDSTSAPTTVEPPVTTTPYISTPYYSTPAPPYITTQSPYKKCYCDCKLGCKEFCRKVSVANPKQQITQITSTGDYAPGGQVEYTHSHQRKYYAKYATPSRYYPKPYPLVYSEAPSSPAGNNINAPNYTLEELAHLLSTAYGAKKGYPASPPTQQQVYYQPPAVEVPKVQPLYKPLFSKVLLPGPTIRTAVAAAVAGSNAIAKAKTPYKEVVATSAPVYENTTPYPIPPPEPEQPKAYAAPEPEPIAVPQTESYPTQTESYPDKSYESPQSNAIKSESSFDMAIDNYLKDFGYGNQVRDLDY